MPNKKFDFDEYTLFKALNEKLDELVGEGSINSPNRKLITYLNRDKDEEGGFTLEVCKELYDREEVIRFVVDFFEKEENWCLSGQGFKKHEAVIKGEDITSCITNIYTYTVRYVTNDVRNKREAKSIEDFFSKYGSARD